MPESRLVQAIVPQWPVGPSVQALCSTRAGGVSRAPWDSLNLGDHVGDDPGSVAANRRLYAQSLGVRPVFLQQVHGTGRVAIDADTPDGTQADACFTRERGVACTIMVADCLPVLFADTHSGLVAAAHAGWRGLLGEGGQHVLASALQPLQVAHTQTWLGPCIGPAAFEVGPEVRQAYIDDDAASVRFFIPASADQSTGKSTGKWLADLPGLARHRLQALGLPPERIHGNDGSPAWCTVTQRSRFFSHRRDGVSGRLAASIWRV